MTSLVRSLLVFATLSLVACKQGEGERCEVNSDCESGLICTTQNVCEETQSSGDLDAAPFDARPPFEPIDGGPDAAADAAPVDAGADAAPADAAPADADVDATLR